ncbi:hypothetical protein ACN20G_20240 [Streptomyces sp. BI20]|uniref:hypothetical protein n=1 Tax=Streptomyces sp. BI20 TaxID=3403460 RepID=UPI003C7815A8
MAKNKNRQQPAKAKTAGSETSKGSAEQSGESTAPSPATMARKSKQVRFGHN